MSTFGAAPPLPGQRGFRKGNESKRLEQEARNMETRLQSLRNELNKSREAREHGKGGGGWRSARADRGGLKGYAKDVRGRKPGARKNGASRATAGGAAKQAHAHAHAHAQDQPQAQAQAQARPTQAAPRTASDDAPGWDVARVGQWLSSIGLSQHAQTFATNEIDGAVLLELGLDDLDYMNVKTLAHRKKLLKGVAELKRGANGAGSGTGTAVLSATMPTPASSAPSENAPRNGNGGQAVHWSHVKPLAENEVSGGAPPINLADGTYDERANRAEFQDALAEWRRGAAGPTRIVHDGDDGSVQIEQEVSADVGGADAMWRNPFATGAADAAPAQALAGVGTAAGGALLGGAPLDEAKEHEDFVKAVNAWRTGSKPPPLAQGKDVGSAGTDTGADGDDKVCCWLSYATFRKSEGHFDKELGHWFKSEHNAQLYREKQQLDEAKR
eukprot:g5970.t1